MSFVETINIADENGDPVGVQTPLQVDGDSIHAVDLDLTNSSIGTFDGVVADLNSLFNDYTNEITDEDATNPKSFTLRFKRPIISNKIGIGSLTGNFSNVKIELKDLAGTVRTTIDDSANNTDYTSNVYAFPTNVFIEAVVTFATVDAVKISGMFIPKSQSINISAIDGYVSETNSTTTPINAGLSFTGTMVDTLNYGMVVLAIKTDQVSATDGLSVQFSTDGTNWDHIDVFTIPAATGKTFSFQTAARFLRVVYTNGGVNQTYFRMQTTLKPVYVKPSSHRVADSIAGQDDAELVKAVLTGLAPDTTFKNVLVTNAGEMKNSLENIDESLTTPNADRTTNLDGEIGLNTNAMMFARVSDTVEKNARLDASTEALITVGYEHHELHDGSHFFIQDWVDLAINNVVDFQFTTPNTTKYIHFTFEISTEAEALWYIYETAVINVAGTAVACLNNNRNSATVCTADAKIITNTSLANANADTDVSGATQLASGIVGAGRTGGEHERAREIILKANTIYALRGIASAAGYFNFNMQWYEHTDRN